MTGSAGKTFSGPQSGVMAWNDPELTPLLLDAVFPALAATHQVNRVAALAARGVRRFVFTDVDRDGMLGGIDTSRIARIADAVEGELLYSGGIGSIEDLRNLRDLRLMNLAGIISGKALYEHKFTVAEAHEILDTPR